jgi:hypothetical protein
MPTAAAFERGPGHLADPAGYRSRWDTIRFVGDTVEGEATPGSGTGLEGRDLGRRRASAIYGTIITASVLAAGGNVLSTAALEATVLVTLIVYWLAEQYAELIGEHTHSGHLPRARQVGHSLGNSWPMVSSSFLPLVVLLSTRVLGASEFIAAEVALATAVGLLIVHGHAMGRAAGLRGFRLAVVTSGAGFLALLLVALKALIQHHHQII